MEKFNREIARDMLLQAKDSKALSWPQLSAKLGRSPVYTAMLVYGYGQATAEEADAPQVRLLGAAGQRYGNRGV